MRVCGIVSFLESACATVGVELYVLWVPFVDYSLVVLSLVYLQ